MLPMELAFEDEYVDVQNFPHLLVFHAFHSVLDYSPKHNWPYVCDVVD